MADPLPGRPESLGRATDLRDARAVLAILNACAETLGPERPRIGLIRIVREALWFIWEAPRLPRPLVATKYPEPYPWSSGARAVFTEHAGKARVAAGVS